jgi:hypothetical protein
MSSAKGRLIEGEKVQERIEEVQVLCQDKDNKDNDNE